MEIVKRKNTNLSRFIIACLLMLAIFVVGLIVVPGGKNADPSKGVFAAFTKTKGDVGIASKASTTELLEVEIDYKSYKKIREKKWSAFNNGVLLSSDDDLVDAQISFRDETLPAEIRLKGDWVEHLDEETWSFRVKMEDNHTINGLRKFSLQHPKTRNYAGEWLFHELLKSQDILSLQYDFLNVDLVIREGNEKKVKHLGYYAFEEFFDKQLIESNNRRAGVILKLDEDPLWQERSKFKKMGIPFNDWFHAEVTKFNNLNVIPFGEKKVNSDPTLSKQFKRGSSLLTAFLHEEKKAAEVYNIEKLAMYNAICNLLGADHSMVLHNIRAYYNPINDLLEPIGFDGNAGTRKNWFSAFSYAEKDMDYQEKYLGKLKEVSSDRFVEQLLNWPGLAEVVQELEATYTEYKWDPEIIRHNQRMIKSHLSPVKFANIFFVESGEDYIRLSIENFHRFPIEIHDLIINQNKVLGFASERIILGSNTRQTVDFKVNKNFQRLFVNKKDRKTSFNASKDIPKLSVRASVLGTNNVSNSAILPWDLPTVVSDNLRQVDNIDQLKNVPFLKIDSIGKRINCLQGHHILSKTLIIPRGYTFEILPNTTLDFTHLHHYIISYSPVKFIGTADQPIRFYSSSSKGNGMLVMNVDETSVLEHCKFENLANPKNGYWAVSGAINFFEAPVDIRHCSFENMRSEDALNIIHTNFTMENVFFSNSFSDAFDGDFVTGTIDQCIFSNLGNDAIDISGSDISVTNTTIFKAHDKGLSAGEKSKIVAEKVSIKDSEIAVASKDNSLIELNNCWLNNNNLGFTAYQKKSEYGPGQIVANTIQQEKNNTLHLIELKSSLILEGKSVEQVNQVIDRMYGKEFGKKSER